MSDRDTRERDRDMSNTTGLVTDKRTTDLYYISSTGAIVRAANLHADSPTM